jgi:histidine triad (HIT) family protein
MADCPVCNAQKKPELILFEDEDIMAYLPEEAAAMAHIIIAPKAHYETIDKTPDYLVAWGFAIAKKLAAILLESIKLQGLNLLIENGDGAGQKLPHFTINLLPRFENDGLPLNWTPKQGNIDELKQVEARMKQALSGNWMFEGRPGQATAKPEPEKVAQDRDNYLIKQLHRIP